jgi:hypothetical protein
VLPADQVKALERLVDEVERVPVVCERSLGCGRKQSVGKHVGRFAPRDRREEGALGRLTVAHTCPPPQPAHENGRLELAVERRTLPPQRFAIAVRSDAACPMK